MPRKSRWYRILVFVFAGLLLSTVWALVMAIFCIVYQKVSAFF